MHPGIVVVGSYNRDLVLRVARLPGAGETCLASGQLESHGGKGSNQAVQAALCGARTAMVAAVGADAAGDAALEMWRAGGIDVSAVVRRPDAATGRAVILVDDAGENSIVVDAGANAGLSAAQVDAAAALIGGASVVAAQLETPAPATKRAFAIARAGGATTLLNAAPAPDAVDAELLALTDILVVNAVEARALGGEAALLARVRQAVVLTLGADGARLLRPGQAPLARAAYPVEVTDTTGAGDAFIGALCARLAEGAELTTALDWGLAAGALACTREGAAASFAARDAIAALAD